jgi:lipoprotein-releasing system permease protein
MNIYLTITIAIGHLRARIKQSAIAALGVTFGIAMFVTLMGFMTGLNQMLDGLVLDRTPHVRIYNEILPSKQQAAELAPELSGDLIGVRNIRPRQTQEKLRNAPAIIQALRADNRVIGVAPQARAQVFYNAGPINLNGVIIGVEVDEEQRLFSTNNYIVEGRLEELKTVNNGIVLGKGLSDKLLATIGDRIQVTTPGGSQFSLKVVGIYQSGLAEIDDTQSYATLSTVQHILGEGSNYITDLNLKVRQIEQAPAMAEEFARIYHADALDIQQANAQFETGTDIRNLITYAVSFALLLVAGFGIYNILNMLIYEKMDDIAILKATGFSGRDVLGIFLIQALLIGIIGGMLGLLLGWSLTAIIDRTPFETDALPTIKTFPINWDPRYYIGGILFALITTFMAGLLPARKAGKIDPVDIIRGK